MKNAQIFVAFSEKLNFSSTKQCDDGAGGRSENLGVHEGICFASISGKICTSKLYIPSTIHSKLASTIFCTYVAVCLFSPKLDLNLSPVLA